METARQGKERISRPDGVEVPLGAGGELRLAREADPLPDLQIIGVDEGIRGHERRHGGAEAPREGEEGIARPDRIGSRARRATHGHVQPPFR